MERIKWAKDSLLPTINGRNAWSYKSCAGCTFLTACRPEDSVAKQKRLLLIDVNNYPWFFSMNLLGPEDPRLGAESPEKTEIVICSSIPFHSIPSNLYLVGGQNPRIPSSSQKNNCSWNSSWWARWNEWIWMDWWPSHLKNLPKFWLWDIGLFKKRKSIDSQNYPVYYYLYQAILWLILIHTNIDPVATAMQKSSRLTAFDVQQVRQRWQHSWGTLGVMVGGRRKKNYKKRCWWSPMKQWPLVLSPMASNPHHCLEVP